MAAKSLTIEFCSPNDPPFEMTADEVIVPGAEGVMTILPGHTLVLTTLKTGVLIVKAGAHQTFFAVHGGFAEIAQDHINIIADQFEQADAIDLARVEDAKMRAEEIIAKPKDAHSVAQAEAALGRAMTRLQAHGHEHY